MPHRTSSRSPAGGGRIQTLEFTAPVAITAGTDYYLTAEGALVTLDDVTPFVAAPLPSLSSLAPGNNWTVLNTAFRNSGGNFCFTQNTLHSALDNSLLYHVFDLSATHEVYITTPSAAPAGFICALVYNKQTKQLVASNVFTVSTASQYAREGQFIALIPSGANRFCMLVDFTTDTGANWQYRVGEFTFNGTNAITFAWKAVLGTAAPSTGFLCGVGQGVSSGKVAVRRDTTYQIINVIANTINAASGFSGSHVTSGQWGLTILNGTQITVANYETNGSSTVTVTGAALPPAGTDLVQLTPTVFLGGVSGLAAGTQDSLRLVVFNAGFTSATCTIMPHPTSIEFNSTLVVQPRSGVLEFIIASGYSNGGAGSNESSNAISFAINSSGVVTTAARMIPLDAPTRMFLLNVSRSGDCFYPLRLDRPVYYLHGGTQLSGGALSARDTSTFTIVKFRPDFYLGPYKPKYVGRALTTVAQNAVASFAASPALMQVDPVQTTFTRVGRIIKVNDLQGFFLDHNVAQYGITQWAETGASNVQFNYGADETGFNYPWVLGEGLPAEDGKLKIAGIGQGGTATLNVRVITPVSINLINLTNSATHLPVMEAAFSGFLVFLIRAGVNTGTSTLGFHMTLEAKEADYV